jgi:hypothetical protein
MSIKATTILLTERFAPLRVSESLAPMLDRDMAIVGSERDALALEFAVVRRSLQNARIALIKFERGAGANPDAGAWRYSGYQIAPRPPLRKDVKWTRQP